MKLTFIIALLCLPVLSGASDIREHASVTNLALEQVDKCLPKKLSQFSKELLVYSNVEEDVNLVRKWITYSHFYSPKKDLRTWRGTSMNRIMDAKDQLRAWRSNLQNLSLLGVSEALHELGHIVHHLQDSTVPSHVIPVKHWLHDSFERYHSEGFVLSLSCAEIVNAQEPDQLLYDSALMTLASLKGSFVGRLNGQEKTLNWDYFWFDTGEKFGSYGYFGNSFGKTALQMPDGLYEIPQHVYRDFWQERRRESIKRTAQAIYWFFSGLSSLGTKHSVEMSEGSWTTLEDLLFEPIN